MWKQAYQGLKAESTQEGNYPRQVLEAHFSYTPTTPVKDPQFLCWSKDLADTMGLKDPTHWLEILSGNASPDELQSLSTRYGGHQFGHWAGQLGDGRAITQGLWENEGFAYEVQLKGAGLTPYSRSADGRAVLRSSLREYLCSEAMAHLGVPTTRALSLVTTGEEVIRDMFYDGNPEAEPGAICSRVAPSFLRFGHFQIHASLGEKERLSELIKFTLDNFGEGQDILSFFHGVVNKTAFMISEWYRLGFVHGVMNTDNMSILGLTIDYGPFGWLDIFDPDWTPNTTDFRERRYRFMNQHNIAYWNLARLAEAIEVVGPSLKEQLEDYPRLFKYHFSQMMQKKLGLKDYQDELTNRIFNLLVDAKGDMTLFYRNLTEYSNGAPLLDWDECFYDGLSHNQQIDLKNWLSDWKRAFCSETGYSTMKSTNPVLIPRNYMIQECLDSLEKGDKVPLRNLEEALLNPYEWNEKTKKYFKKRPNWAATRPGCSTLSCSS